MSAKMRSGVGRFVLEGVAMKFGSVWKVWCVQIYTDGGVRHLSQFRCSIRLGLAYFLSPHSVRGAHYETRISPLALSAAGHRHGRDCPRALGTANSRVSDQRG